MVLSLFRGCLHDTVFNIRTTHQRRKLRDKNHNIKVQKQGKTRNMWHYSPVLVINWIWLAWQARPTSRCWVWQLTIDTAQSEGRDKRLSFKFPLHAIGKRFNQPERFPKLTLDDRFNFCHIWQAKKAFLNKRVVNTSPLAYSQKLRCLRRSWSTQWQPRPLRSHIMTVTESGVTPAKLRTHLPF